MIRNRIRFSLDFGHEKGNHVRVLERGIVGVDIEKVGLLVKEFSKQSQGSAALARECFFVKGVDPGEYAPLKFLTKEGLGGVDKMLGAGMVCNSLGLFRDDHFSRWFERLFSKKLTPKMMRQISLLHKPNTKAVFKCVEQVDKAYELLRQEQIISNGKNLPVQLGEWYAKCIFGLEQRKSTSQRGFDFFLQNKRIEVKTHWPERISLKGVKIKKSLLNLSEYALIIYLMKNLKIQEICLLDSEFITRKFSSKSPTIFLKEEDISSYFFSRSRKHIDKVINCSFLVRCSSPEFAMNISEYF